MFRLLVVSLFVITTIPTTAFGQSLRGSGASLDRQNRVADRHDFTRIQTGDRVHRFANAGYLVRVPRNGRHFRLHAVSYPYARPEVKLFIERLGPQYQAACGRELVVTSLTRPMQEQPANGSRRSVHPAGMALDLRYSRSAKCRQWLERVLLDLEGAGILDATRERRPPHYHVAIFPTEYERYVARITGRQPQTASGVARTASRTSKRATTRTSSEAVYHHVVPGHNLTAIAGRYGVTVNALMRENELRSSRIRAGQTLRIPAVSHRVARGETLSEIAAHYGVSQGKIRRVNGKNDSTIYVNESLIIPLDN